MARVWVLFVDLDRTLWDHRDVSSLSPPFARISEDVIVDRNGNRVKLYREMVELVEWAKRKGAIVSTLSWNKPENALAALKTFGIVELFDYHAIDVHPRKGEYARRVLNEIESSRGIKFKGCQIVYIDDRDIHLEDVKKHLGDIIFIRAWKDFRSPDEAKAIIKEKLCVEE